MRYLILLLLCSCAPELVQVNTPGPIGPQGPKGDAGAPASNNVYVVHLCPNHGVTSYPAAFAEVALCIDNKLYATYWDGHNAWMTDIPPGNYVSTSSSVPCSFTAYLNCVVQD